MAMTELEKFLEAIKADPELERQLSALDGEAEAWMSFAQSKGFRLSPEEAAELCATYGDELDDGELEDVAGGWTEGSSGTGPNGPEGGG